jgi:O-antigen ligase
VALPRPLIFTLAALFFLVTVSFVLNLFWQYPYPLRTYEARFGYTGDSISRYIYFIIALLAFFISADAFRTDAGRYINLWLLGALVAALYSWYLMAFSLLHLPVFLLPGMKDPPQMIRGYIIRTGTFAEGNFMGLYLFLSGVMAFYIRKFKTGLFLFASIFTTFATLSIVSAFIFLVYYLRQFIFRKKYIPYFFLGLLLAIPALGYFSTTKLYQDIHDKIFGSSNRITNEATYSKVDRLISIRTAYRTGLANPVLGVGLSNYSRHYDRFYLRDNLSENDYKTFRRPNDKTIPNNIYLEVFAESGLPALLAFLLFLALLIYYAGFGQQRALVPGMLCLLLCFVAYPSFIMIYLWSFMALPVAHFVQHVKNPTWRNNP